MTKKQFAISLRIKESNGRFWRTVDILENTSPIEAINLITNKYLNKDSVRKDQMNFFNKFTVAFDEAYQFGEEFIEEKLKIGRHRKN